MALLSHPLKCLSCQGRRERKGKLHMFLSNSTHFAQHTVTMISLHISVKGVNDFQENISHQKRSCGKEPHHSAHVL